MAGRFSLVAAKVAILLVFAGGGLYYGVTHGTVASGVDALSVGALTAAAIAFVAFEGWELLLFDQDSIENPEKTIRKGIYISIVGTTILFMLVAMVTTNLVSEPTIKAHSETALAIAAEPLLGQLGFTLIAVAAVLSTGSVLNATLFSASRLSAQISEATTGDTRSTDTRSSTDGGVTSLHTVSPRRPTDRLVRHPTQTHQHVQFSSSGYSRRFSHCTEASIASPHLPPVRS